MSFWPFLNLNGNSTHLQKFLDSATDLSAVTAQSLLDNKVLQQELLEELKTICSKSSKSNGLLFTQLLLNEAQTKALVALAATDNSSVTSLNPDSNNVASLSKTAREQKLLELLLQPHILHGLLDYLVMSVDFFYDLAKEKQAGKTEEIDDLSEDNTDSIDTTGGDNSTPDKRKPKSDADAEDTESYQEKVQRCILCSAEILSADCWAISSRIVETPSLMCKLWLILSLPKLQESSPSLAYLIQVLGHLLESNRIELLNFIRKRDDLVDTFLRKVDIPILMDYFLKIIQTDKANAPSGILSVLARQNIIPKLMDVLRPPTLTQADLSEANLPDADLLFRQTAATEFIKTLVTISSNPTLAVDPDVNIGPNELTRELASPQIISVMLNDIMLQRIQTSNGWVANKHGLSNCVSILIELIRKNNSDYDSNCGKYTQQSESPDAGTEVNSHTMCLWLKDLDENPPGPRDPVFLGDLLRIFSDGLPALVDMMKTDFPPLDGKNATLGLTKFKIAELVAELLHCSNMILLNSNKVAHLVHIRDKLRALQLENIQTALNEPLLEDGANENASKAPLSRITSGMDNISLEQGQADSEVADGESSLLVEHAESDLKYRTTLKDFLVEDTEDEEPSVSSENPFVCEERDKAFRANPCAGDYFKIQLIDLHMLSTIVGLFTEFPWHNFFHNVVFDLVQQVFNGKLNSYNSFLIVELFEKCGITNTIVEAFRIDTQPRPGYMGHLILVSEEVVKFSSLYKPSLISPTIVKDLGSKEWEWFVSEVLLKTRELYNVVLGTDPDYSIGSDEGNIGQDHDFGFDSSTVGYMDDQDGTRYQRSPPIILGDSSNHEEFVNYKPDLSRKEKSTEEEVHTDDENLTDDEDNEDFAGVDEENNLDRKKILDVPINNMSPNAEFANKDMLYEDFGGAKLNFADERYLDDFPGSSSSDEESENLLYRVSKHHE